VQEAGVQLLDSDGDYNWEYEEVSGKFRRERPLEDGTELKTFEEVVRDHGPVSILIEDFTAADLGD